MRSNTHWVLTPTKALFRRLQYCTNEWFSLIAKPTMTQCVLISNEQDRKPTAAFIRTEVLFSFLPLLTVRGDAKLGFKFKIWPKINVRFPVYPKSSPVRCLKSSAVRKFNSVSVKVGVSIGSGKKTEACFCARCFCWPAAPCILAYRWPTILSTKAALNGTCKAIEGLKICRNRSS